MFFIFTKNKLMPNAIIPASSFKFLKSLTRNNNREWFNKNKETYLAEHEHLVTFADGLLAQMQQHDHIENLSGKSSLSRIYRDTRFSKDKTPYRTYWPGGFQRATKQLRGGYYFQIGPGVSLAAGGFFSPNPADLLRIRQDMDMNYPDWKKLLSSKGIAQTFGTLKGEKVATAPKGFSKDNPAIALLQHKQVYLERRFSDEEALAPGFMKQLNQTFKNLRPFFDYMSEVLTTNLNGESLLEE
jgi:uncharacterized protein (TIGR02453 family)